MTRKKTGRPVSIPTGKKAVKKINTAKGSQKKRTPSGLPDSGYGDLLKELKNRVRAAQLKAAVTVNRELIQLYWDVGRRIVERQEQEGWGTGVIDRLATDLQNAFPGIKGFSLSNVSRMRSFFCAYSREIPNLAQAVPKLKVPRSSPTDSAQVVPNLAKSKT